MESIQQSNEHDFKEQLIDQLLDIVLNEGWQQLDMYNVACNTGISLAELQLYFPDLQALTSAVNLRLTEHFIQHLNMDSREEFKKSWIRNLENPRFSAIVRVFIDASQQQSIAWRLANIGWTQLTNHVSQQLGYHAVNQDLPWLLGKSLLRIISRRPRAYRSSGSNE